MTRNDPNAALARRLAPLVGEAAVYDPAPECPSGHSLTSYQPPFDWEIGAVCQECALIQVQAAGIPDYYRALEWARAHTDRAEWEIGKTPRAFTNPSVLLAVVRALGKDHLFGMPISRLTRMAPDDATLYLEPFCGGLAVALGLRPARALLNDVNHISSTSVARFSRGWRSRCPWPMTATSTTRIGRGSISWWIPAPVFVLITTLPPDRYDAAALGQTRVEQRFQFLKDLAFVAAVAPPYRDRPLEPKGERRAWKARRH
jgi:hypothetical protein